MTTTGSAMETRCSVAVFRDDRVLLVRGVEEGRTVWKLPGGHVRADEGLRACGRRELREETGLEAGELRCGLLLEVHDPDTGRYVSEVVLFPLEAVRGEPRTAEAGREPRFVPMEALDGLPLRPRVAAHLHDLRELHLRDLAEQGAEPAGPGPAPAAGLMYGAHGTAGE
jgi:ADP-ribose pyrophosphatase YjhB (NUDIX family)